MKANLIEWVFEDTLFNDGYTLTSGSLVFWAKAFSSILVNFGLWLMIKTFKSKIKSLSKMLSRFFLDYSRVEIIDLPGNLLKAPAPKRLKEFEWEMLSVSKCSNCGKTLQYKQ